MFNSNLIKGDNLLITIHNDANLGIIFQNDSLRDNRFPPIGFQIIDNRDHHHEEEDDHQ